ncbi:hypothetical protein G7046_g9988 [Stylonectria norvegica]|nr:hypothetical protein G7046_g9988 [Stylonectria norvegica]
MFPCAYVRTKNLDKNHLPYHQLAIEILETPFGSFVARAPSAAKSVCTVAMPSVAGYQRLNEKKSQPNPNIVFIKPLKGPDEKIAQDFLERIAAQCRPVMREHYLYVTSLEEYEPNREFVGRNFNAGEVVQLVLKSPRTGRWLPFDYVQMVMMHELAHCKQMNHSKAFWTVRNSYASQMHTLWFKGYTGDGLWGKGAKLRTGEWEGNTVLADEVLPEHLCGGTYQSRSRKRKVKPTLTYQERKERRILKKFGKNGTALGADEEAKVKLEKGKKVQAKPRVAGSARGRELRAAAALARFEVKTEEPGTIKNEDETESGSDSEYDDAASAEQDSKDAVDLDGHRLLDGKGRGMVKVCDDEDADDPAARNEHEELQGMFRRVKRESLEPQITEPLKDNAYTSREVKQEAHDDSSSEAPTRLVKQEPSEGPWEISVPARSTKPDSIGAPRRANTPATQVDAGIAGPSKTNIGKAADVDNTTGCSVCSFANPQLAVTCTMCANVLDPSVTTSWQCTSGTCQDSSYRNSADCGVCGLCGRRRGDALG